MTRHPDTTLAILAGGRGRRLGGIAKGLLEYQGRTLVERLLDLAERFAGALLVTDDSAPWSQLGVRVVPDVVKDRGAPGGLHAALVHAPTPWVVLVACDMPFVRAEVLEHLLGSREGEVEWVCAERGGYLEPMPGVYAARMAPAIASALPGNPSLQALLRGSSGKALPLSELAALDPELRSWVSVNTPEDAERFGVSLPRGGTR
ncbi:MAG TPA: molybdenum cofactor guanylyltransferase [Myxococcaceae bacterium]|nr:molybdenum cofactor guanylyltransferase [Myxococcaceae bacterium]